MLTTCDLGKLFPSTNDCERLFPLALLLLKSCLFCCILTGADYFVYVPACSVAKSCLTLCDPVTVVRQAPLSMGFYRQEYWSGLPIPLPGDLSNQGVEPTSPASPILAGRFFTAESPWKLDFVYTYWLFKFLFKNCLPQTLSYVASIFQVFKISLVVLFIVPFVCRQFSNNLMQSVLSPPSLPLENESESVSCSAVFH